MKRYLKIVYRWLFRRKKTYSQIGEDCIAEFYLPQTGTGVYVDVGANDPVYTSNTYLFYKKGWRGICIEPDPAKCGVFRLIRPRDTVVHAGAGNQPGNLDFYVFDPDTLSTFSKEEAEKYKAQGYKHTETMRVPVRTLKDILSQHAPEGDIDLLSVDTEGFDMQVLEGNDWDKFRPKMVIVEVVGHNKIAGSSQGIDFDGFFESKGYKKFASTHLNNIYLEKGYATEKGIV